VKHLGGEDERMNAWEHETQSIDVGRHDTRESRALTPDPDRVDYAPACVSPVKGSAHGRAIAC
jgi:hypothetical protein